MRQIIPLKSFSQEWHLHSAHCSILMNNSMRILANLNTACKISIAIYNIYLNKISTWTFIAISNEREKMFSIVTVCILTARYLLSERFSFYLTERKSWKVHINAFFPPISSARIEENARSDSFSKYDRVKVLCIVLDEED